MDWFDTLQHPLYDLNTEIISNFSDFNNEKSYFYGLNNIIVEEVLVEAEEEIPQFSASACVNQTDLNSNDEDIGLAADNHMNMEDLQGNDDSRAYFLCPFCYVEIELRVLCSHLQEEHCFGLNNAVCPLCAANLGKDPLGHFTMQHSHSVKRKRKSRKSGVWGNCPTIIGKDFREMSSFFGSSSISGRNNVQDPAPDPLLSPFLSNMPLLDPKADLEDKSSSSTTSLDHNVTSDWPTILDEFSEQDYEERGRRAVFAQELILSAIF